MNYKITFIVGKTLAEIKERAARNMEDWYNCISDARSKGEDVTEAQEIYRAWVDVYTTPVAYLPQNLSKSK